MRCLNCGEPMVALELSGFEVDTCLGCSGIWLDSGELEMLLGNTLPDKLLNFEGGSARSRRKCPVCNKKMEVSTVGTTNVAEIDSCPLGHGLWFDRGELETLVEFLDEPLRTTIVDQMRAIFSTEHKQAN